MLDNAPNQPTKFKTKNWIEINDYTRETYNKDKEIKFKTSMLKSSLCDYNDAYILFKGTTKIEPVAPPAANPNNNDKKVIFENSAPYADSISEINNTEIDNAKDINVVMSMYNLIDYSNNY